MWGRLLQLCGLLGGAGTGLLLTLMIVHGDFPDMPRVASALGVPHGVMVLGMRASSNLLVVPAAGVFAFYRSEKSGWTRRSRSKVVNGVNVGRTLEILIRNCFYLGMVLAVIFSNYAPETANSPDVIVLSWAAPTACFLAARAIWFWLEA
eukprot:Transcript_3609.p1 GENE.Transcript_3609~~Transcript_3609.p1  ORF type:complete len:150 (-),score=17.95 Transcript_3609:104-553(-)